tara:strand:+ start:1213 stop:1950 length:738 start_codon:yes stop_codon:yes gene_type:complete
MALPKVVTPTYELKVPSTGQKVKYRPFLVKEEKTLLMAMESGSEDSMNKAMQDIIESCSEGKIDTKKLAPFDIEFFFLHLRGKSVGEKLNIKVPRPEDLKCCKDADAEDICEVDVNIEDIKVDTTGAKSSEIQITENIGLKLNYPNVDLVNKYATAGENITSANVFKLISECIDYIWDGEEIYKGKDSTKKELDEFMESLSSGQFNKVREFFESMPRLQHEINWICPKCKKLKPLVLAGVDSFFA